ncbi:hypothetical protein M9H77_30343 [Catharanthus roseus]|uniref:Uncharacterized protein n=1 Tax=Catharanthus roseus TaxID=4058 RepID=A0ACB9ZXC5_CATRO|nr:hypothetical protein M9H77_30343 [Catharanthus roseus]
MQEHQGVVTRAKAKQLKNHKDQIEQEKFERLNFDVQDSMRLYPKVLNKTTKFHQPPYFDEELHPSPYDGRRGGFGRRGMPRHFEKVPRPQARHGEPLYVIMNMFNLLATMEETEVTKPWTE